MNGKIIVSSGAMLKLLNELSLEFDMSRTITLGNNRLDIDGATWKLDVEHRGEFKREYSNKQLSKLLRFLKDIPEQPITLNFTDDWDNSIEILCAVITGN